MMGYSFFIGFSSKVICGRNGKERNMNKRKKDGCFEDIFIVILSIKFFRLKHFFFIELFLINILF